MVNYICGAQVVKALTSFQVLITDVADVRSQGMTEFQNSRGPVNRPSHEPQLLLCTSAEI